MLYMLDMQSFQEHCLINIVVLDDEKLKNYVKMYCGNYEDVNIVKNN